jgi:NAD(P)-dependent dehydrogenase (short-subunit alcohol dehydrogenase family)
MPAPYKFETTAEEVIADLKTYINGQVILTTGVSPGGLGAHFVEQIAAAQPKLLILAGRNKSKVEATAQKIAEITNGSVDTRALELDLGSLAKVREAAAIVNAYSESIDVLVNNAGIMATDYARTADGVESQFGTNHIGPWLFTNLIIDKVLASPTPRIVNVSSDGYRMSPIRFHDHGFKVCMCSSARAYTCV